MCEHVLFLVKIRAFYVRMYVFVHELICERIGVDSDFDEVPLSLVTDVLITVLVFKCKTKS